jgi:DedD protein
MRSTFEDELAPAAAQASHDREVTLSTGTLLGIFFGLVLICALFFAFGYTVGRRSSSDAVQAGLTATQPSMAASTNQAKPSAGSPSVIAIPASDPDTVSTDGVTDADAMQIEPVKERPTSPDGMAIAPPSSLPVAPTAGSAVGLAPGTIVGVMVQIAAVSNAADADVLVSALHRRGYTVTVRHDPADALTHVQIGPFANRADAVAMRQKLLGDGYNAILK